MSLLARVRSAAREMLISNAEDRTVEAAKRSALVLAPHPDDETIGCGGRILQATRGGADVTVVVATDGAASHDDAGSTAEQLRSIRHRELVAATGALGVVASDIVELGFPDGDLATHEHVLADELVRLLVERRPDEVFTTSVWETHPDHAAAGRALRAAISQLSADPPEGLVLPRHYEYPIWLWGDWPISKRWLRKGPAQWWALRAKGACHTIRLDDVAEQKQNAMRCYASQLGVAVDGVSVGLPPELLDRARRGPELFFDVTRLPH